MSIPGWDRFVDWASSHYDLLGWVFIGTGVLCIVLLAYVVGWSRGERQPRPCCTEVIS